MRKKFWAVGAIKLPTYVFTGLLENALSLRTSARWCGTPRVFPSGTIPRIFKHLGRKTKLFPSNRGAATPL